MLAAAAVTIGFSVSLKHYLPVVNRQPPSSNVNHRSSLAHCRRPTDVRGVAHWAIRVRIVPNRPQPLTFLKTSGSRRWVVCTSFPPAVFCAARIRPSQNCVLLWLFVHCYTAVLVLTH